MNYKFAVFAYGDVGAATVRMFRDNINQLEFVLLDKENFWNKNHLIIEEAEKLNVKYCYYENDDQLKKICQGLDVVILAWWGKIIPKEVISIPSNGIINLHTSYLPYGKGKHPHYWAITEDTPYGVTIMKIDEGLDTGNIIFQKQIKKTWEDTGKTLYFKGIKALCALLEEKKDDILNLNFKERSQEGIGSFHYGKEINDASFIELNREYKAKDLLNVIRARTFAPFPAAYFYYNNEKYEVRVQINKVTGKSENNINYDEISMEGLKINE